MPKHLFTIPNGTELPDITGLPEGYPFLLVASDAVPGVLYVLQGSTFVQPAQPAPAVTAARTPVTFVIKIPAKPVADATAQDINASYEGVPSGAFVVPAGLAATSSALGQLREITLTTDTPWAALTDTVTLRVNVQKPGGGMLEFGPTTGAWVLTTTAPTVATGNVTYDATLTANQMPVGTLVTASVHVGGAYANAGDAYVIATLHFGEAEKVGAMVGEGEGQPMLETELNAREAQLA